jgi:hypothetical protein
MYNVNANYSVNANEFMTFMRLNNIPREFMNKTTDEFFTKHDILLQEITGKDIRMVADNMNVKLNNVEYDEVVDKVIKEAGQYYEGGYDALVKYILETNADGNQEIDLHNAVVDNIITLFNYMGQLKKQGKKLPKKFIVLDMETIDDENGIQIPYQLNVLRVTTDENGNIKFNILM